MMSSHIPHSIIDTVRVLGNDPYKALKEKLEQIHSQSKGPLRVAVIGA